LIELIEDAFDLCRYYNILTQAPHGKACPYKEMGKCPAPCDGSISIGQYRRLIDFSLQAIAEPSIFIADQIRRMESAAAELRFETAAKIHSYVDHLRDLGRGAFRFARPISDFQFVTLQTGPGKQSVKIFLITLGRIEPILSLRGEPASWQELHHTILTRAEESHHAPAADQGVPRIPGEPRSGVKHGFSPSAGTPGEGQGGGLGPHGEQGRLVERIPPPLSSPGVPGEDVRAPGILGTPADHAAGRIGVVVHHLFSSRKKAGAWIPLAEVNESALSAAYRLLSRNRAQAADKSQRVSPMPGVEADHE
jgi:hypothetical protein